MRTQTQASDNSMDFIGMYERHLLRKDRNPLFGSPDHPPEAYLEARRLDRLEQQRFEQDMRSVIQQAINLEPNAESEVVLALRGRLDELYTRCSGLGDHCVEHKQALRKLIDIVMKAVWQAAADDPQARMELEQEELARQQHFLLLEYPLIADMMRPDTPIAQDELIPTLLQAEEDELEAVLWMFEPQQLGDICSQADALLRELTTQGHALTSAWRNLEMIAEHLECSE
ncbi:MAG: hypothetical protein K0A95_09995 [Chromatiales bacterium]|nr:hypothetical protein [Gammaproteobacteria bacterium]MBW6477390.1 hypothetical protein [Chromatiales bacterium]